MKKFWISALAVSLFPFSASALTFDEALGFLTERSDALKVSLQEADYRRYQAQAAKSLSGPKVTASVMEIQGRKDIDLNFNRASFLPITISKKMDISGPRATIDAYWPLYTGGAISAKQSALDASAQEAAAMHDDNRQSLELELVQRYFGLDLAIRVRHLRESIAKQALEDYHRAQRFEKAGLSSHLETLNALVTSDTAKRDLSQAQTDEQIAKRHLMSLIHVETLTDPESVVPVKENIGTLAYWQDLAIGKSPKLAAIAAKESQAQSAVDAARSAWHPKVYLFGRYNAIKHYLTIPEPDWIAGLGVSFTLWDKLDRNASVRAATALSGKARAARDETTRKILDATETAWLKTHQAYDAWKLSNSTVQLAQENLRLRQKAFAEGLARVDEVDTARNKYIEAVLGREVAAYRYAVTFAYLHAAAGDMQAFTSVIQTKGRRP